ncbi:MAG: polyketide cyclase [Chloroflexota bacterium]
MASNDYHFITHWRVESTVREIFEVLANGRDLVRWWPSVYLDVTQLEPGNANGIGKVVSLYTKGWLPYTLRWTFRVTDVHPNGFTLEAWGDFNGHGIWTFEQDDAFTNITYDWKIQADKPLLRDLSFIMKPLFSMNHEWAMRKGEESLNLELARRHAKSLEERARIPAPPPATPTSPIPLLAATAAMFAVSGAILYGLWNLLMLGKDR